MFNNVGDRPVLKRRPEDFLVFESAAIRMHHHGDGAFQYLRLRKRGFTTFDAVAAIADFAGLQKGEVSYAGLKDEDAVTDQLVCVHIPGRPYPIDGFNQKHATDASYLQLIPSGSGDQPLRIGRLDGNSFRIVIRNLVAATSEALAGRRHNHLFLNYYDTQRFGVPGGPRVTHLVGGRLSAADTAGALDLVIQSGATESAVAQSWIGTPEEFFDSLDPRLRSFYLSAHASHQWNEVVAALADRCGDVVTEHRDGIPFRFARSRDAVAEIAAGHPELAYVKYRSDDNGDIVPASSTRCTVVQTQVVAGQAVPDDAFPDRYQCEISMFLPSGCYATTAIAQLLTQLSGCENIAELVGEAPKG